MSTDTYSLTEDQIKHWLGTKLPLLGSDSLYKATCSVCFLTAKGMSLKTALDHAVKKFSTSRTDTEHYVRMVMPDDFFMRRQEAKQDQLRLKKLTNEIETMTGTTELPLQPSARATAWLENLNTTALFKIPVDASTKLSRSQLRQALSRTLNPQNLDYSVYGCDDAHTYYLHLMALCEKQPSYDTRLIQTMPQYLYLRHKGLLDGSSPELEGLLGNLVMVLRYHMHNANFTTIKGAGAKRLLNALQLVMAEYPKEPFYRALELAYDCEAPSGGTKKKLTDKIFGTVVRSHVKQLMMLLDNFAEVAQPLLEASAGKPSTPRSRVRRAAGRGTAKKRTYREELNQTLNLKPLSTEQKEFLHTVPLICACCGAAGNGAHTSGTQIKPEDLPSTPVGKLSVHCNSCGHNWPITAGIAAMKKAAQHMIDGVDAELEASFRYYWQMIPFEGFETMLTLREPLLRALAWSVSSDCHMKPESIARACALIIKQYPKGLADFSALPEHFAAFRAAMDDQKFKNTRAVLTAEALVALAEWNDGVPAVLPPESLQQLGIDTDPVAEESVTRSTPLTTMVIPEAAMQLLGDVCNEIKLQAEKQYADERAGLLEEIEQLKAEKATLLTSNHRLAEQIQAARSVLGAAVGSSVQLTI